MWTALFGFTATSIGAAALHTAYFNLDAAQLPIAPEPHWGLWLRREWHEPMGYVSLAAPMFAIIALTVRRWRPLALGVLAATALFQVATLLLEYHWKEQERAGVFNRPSLLERTE